jgi:hypothetical protein
VESYEKMPELMRKVTNWDENLTRRYNVWKITHGRFLNLKESSRPKPDKENTLKDFCLAKGLAKPEEIWEGSLRKSIESKENEKIEIYRQLKTSRSIKRKLELRKHCQEILATGIANPKASQATLEQEMYEEIRILRNANLEDNTPLKMTSPAPRKNMKKTKVSQNSPLVPRVARKLGLAVVPRAMKLTEPLQRTHLPSAQFEARKSTFKPVTISSSTGDKPPKCTLVNRAGPPMGGEEGTADRAPCGRLANRSRGFEAELPINSKD